MIAITTKSSTRVKATRLGAPWSPHRPRSMPQGRAKILVAGCRGCVVVAVCAIGRLAEAVMSVPLKKPDANVGGQLDINTLSAAACEPVSYALRTPRGPRWGPPAAGFSQKDYPSGGKPSWSAPASGGG